MSLSAYIREAGNEFAIADAATIPDILARHLARLVGPPYSVRPGCVSDADGRQSATFAAVVSVQLEAPEPLGDRIHAANNCAAVVDAIATLDVKELEASYRRIAQTKRLRKDAPTSHGPHRHTTATLGLVIAQRATLTAEVLLDEIQHLNAQFDSSEWPDMIAVSTFGVMNYMVQFPGESISGDYLLPTANTFDRSVPPIYIIPVVKPAGEDSFERLTAFLVGHLALFAPDAQLPDPATLLNGMPDRVITGVGYQYNLQGKLVPVPEEQCLDRQLPVTPLQIEHSQGGVLATIQLVPWQNGGVVILEGKFPLEAILLFGGTELVRRGHIVRPNGIKISNVVPLTEPGFAELIKTFQRQSNMTVRQPQSAWTIQKTGDEGTGTPIIGRLYFGILRIRDVVCQGDESRKQFDKLYEPVLSGVMTARSQVRKIADLWLRHSNDVATGKIAQLQGRVIQVSESIDGELRAGLESFVNASVRALKQGLQQLVSEYGLNLGFLFQPERQFNEKMELLRRERPSLAAYLASARLWTEPLVELRNNIEHKGWRLERVTFAASGDAIVAQQPAVDGIPLIEYLETTLNRLACFVEEMTALALAGRMPPIMALTEIPIESRSARAPERFRVTLASGGELPWELRYTDAPFDER